MIFHSSKLLVSRISPIILSSTISQKLIENIVGSVRYWLSRFDFFHFKLLEDYLHLNLHPKIDPTKDFPWNLILLTFSSTCYYTIDWTPITIFESSRNCKGEKDRESTRIVRVLTGIFDKNIKRGKFGTVFDITIDRVKIKPLWKGSKSL